MDQDKNQEKKKKGGVTKAIFKLLTLGGLLVIIHKAISKNKESQK